MDLPNDWAQCTLPESKQVFYYNRSSHHCQFDPPLYEVLDLSSINCDAIGKKDVKNAWRTKTKFKGAVEPPLVREAYQTLRFTKSRLEFNRKNLSTDEALKANSSLFSLKLLWDGN
jgi:hypothetical protein